MQFDTAGYLRKATSRAKSDVANKLISMLLHEISRRVVGVVGMGVTDAVYTRDVVATFGDRCGYCQRVLESGHTSVEHMEGMNRFRIGLHVPGNVIVACKQCNGSKRRDDQLPTLILAESGWESFLNHDGTRCHSSCKTCGYWQTVWPDFSERTDRLRSAVQRIRAFRESYKSSDEWSIRIRASIKTKTGLLYRECQNSVHLQIQTLAAELFQEMR